MSKVTAFFIQGRNIGKKRRIQKVSWRNWSCRSAD